MSKPSLLVASVIALLVLACFCGAGGSTGEGTAPQGQDISDGVAGLHNVIPFSEGVISGSAPEGEAGFDSLRAMGVRTLISVDAVRPNVEAARSRGMRYVQIPTQYNGISTEERLALAQALRELPRPIYVHCHHGKHRGPAAAVVGLILLGEIDSAAGADLLKRAGTSPSYPGLWECAHGAQAMDAAALDALQSDLPEVATVSGLARNMSEMDRAWDHLKLIRKNGWAPPRDHPDLVPSAEAARVREAFRVLLDDAECQAMPEPFMEWLTAASQQAGELEHALVVGAAREELDQLHDAMAESCSQCHRDYRD